MDLVRGNIKKLKFRKLDLTNLRKLGSLVSDPEKFRGRFGRLLSILKTDVEEGVLNTLVQFYDPLYHCFTFLDYQLLLTLEEYSYLVGLPVSDKVPFSGLEEVPKPLAIATTLHLKIMDMTTNFTSRGGFQGLTSRFLINKAFVSLKQQVWMLLRLLLLCSYMGLCCSPISMTSLMLTQSKSSYPEIRSLPCLPTHIIPFIIELIKEMELSFVVHPCCIGGLCRTYPKPLSLQRKPR
jgi:hypothetical protein